MQETLIHIEGKNAVEIALKFQNGACYRKIISHNKVLAQVESVLDDLVCVTVLDGVDVEKVIKHLGRIGFGGITCNVDLFETTDCRSNFVKSLGQYII